MRYFTNRARRLVRTLEDREPITFPMEDEQALHGWREASSAEYDLFIRQNNEWFTAAKLRQIRSGAKTYAMLSSCLDEEGEQLWVLRVGHMSVFLGATRRKAITWAKDNGYIVVELAGEAA